MKVLVTGSTGQLGSEVVNVCRQEKDKVIPMRRADVDLSDGDSLDKFIRQYRPSHIIHCAAFTHVDNCESSINEALQINGEATARIVMNAQKVGAHITYISTDYVFDGQKDEPYSEDDRPNPINIYGVTKLSGELTLRPTDAIVRVSWVFGKNGNNIVKTILNAAKETNEFKFVDDQIGSPTFAEDAAKVIVKISRESQSGIWHVTNQGTASWYQFAKDVLDVAGITHVDVIPISTEELHPQRLARRPKNSLLANTRLLSEEGYEPLPHYRDALERFIPTIKKH